MKICTLNVRGMGDKHKWRAIFQHLCNNKDLDIILLQETHIKNKEQVKLWECEWGGKIYASCGESNVRGVITMIHPNSVIKLENVKGDQNGRLVCGELVIGEKRLILCNVYAPNNDDSTFFLEMVKLVDSYTATLHEGVIVAGDFNLVLDPEKDRRGASMSNHERSLQILVDYMERASLCDVWRTMNPSSSRYTWHRWVHHQPQASRINMILIPQWMMDCVRNTSIDAGFKTDHSMVTMCAGVEEFRRGPGVWCFNSRLLRDERFCKEMHDVIESRKYLSGHLDPNDRWEFLKMEIGYFCKKFAKNRARRKKDKIKKLLAQKTGLEEKVATCNNDNTTLIEQINHINNERF